MDSPCFRVFKKSAPHPKRIRTQKSMFPRNVLWTPTLLGFRTLFFCVPILWGSGGSLNFRIRKNAESPYNLINHYMLGVFLNVFSLKTWENTLSIWIYGERGIVEKTTKFVQPVKNNYLRYRF
jgi:hypothetical protein